VIPINHDHSNLVKFTEDSVDYAVIARKLREVSGDATVDSPQDVPALATATDNGERSTFDSRRLFTSLSRSFPWMQKPKAVTATNTGMLLFLYSDMHHLIHSSLGSSLRAHHR